LLCDLSSQEEIRALAERVNAEYRRLDVLVNNAGGVLEPRKETVDGIEYTWALNQLAGFMLTHLLLDKLKATGQARIVNVSSIGHQGEINFDDIEMKSDYKIFNAYMQSKLAIIISTYELDRRLGDHGVTVNVLHPGWVARPLEAGPAWLSESCS
jgi:NAD(P)-dependent dehydrogenase (short-subunit alcohol dehydrogenase family)